MDRNPLPKKPTIRIMRPGTFTSMEGAQVAFTRDDLISAAQNYDADADPAPLVIGHPRADHPAWGWVGSLRVEGDELIADADDIDASFAEDVRAKKYRKVSASWYPPQHPNNPKPGQYYLKHVGFLGAHAPGVRGLGTVSFSAGDDADLATLDIISFSTPTQEQPKVTDTPKKTDEQAKADAAAATDAASLAERERKLAEREKAAEKRDKIAAEAAQKAAHDANVSFAEQLQTEGKLAPAGKDLLVGVMDQLETTATVSFGESAGDMTPAAAMKKLIGGAQPLIDLGERGGKPKDGASAVSFAAPAGYQVDDDKADLYARAKAVQRSNPKLSWMDAVREAEAG